jgi:GNAT superfamily N-acetyltransferase
MPALDLPNGYYDLPKGKLANVVISLEMKAPPKQPLPPFPPDLTLRRFSGGEVDAYRELFRAVGQNFMWLSRLIMPDDELAAILGNPNVHAFTLLRGNEPLGIMELNFMHEPDCELAFFGLVPDAIGQGLGRALMDEAIRRAWAQPISRLWVHTCTHDSPQALPFYVRAGFTPYARMVEIHDDPRLLGKMPRHASPQVPILD